MAGLRLTGVRLCSDDGIRGDEMWRLASDDEYSTSCAKLRSILSMRPLRRPPISYPKYSFCISNHSVHVYVLLSIL